MELFLKTVITLTTQVAGSAQKWFKKKKKDKKRAQSKFGKTRWSPSSRCKVHPSTEIDVPRQHQVSNFEFVRVLGQGGYGKVFLAKEDDTQNYWAVKAVRKDLVVSRGAVRGSFIEKDVLTLGSSFPYLPTLHSTFTTPTHLFYAMEYLSGGDLFFHKALGLGLEIDRVRFYAAEISAALQFLHRNGIIYRDLKMENVLLDSEGHCKLADFGCCERVIPGLTTFNAFVGTVEFMAPEVVKKEHYSFAVDWWSFGVLCYEMITGELPFNGNNPEEIIQSITSSKLEFPDNTSLKVIAFLSALMNRNPKERLGCMEDVCPIRKHSFFEEIDWDKLDKKQLVPPFKPEIVYCGDSSNFDMEYTGQPVRLTAVDPNVAMCINQTVFQGFTSTAV